MSSRIAFVLLILSTLPAHADVWSFETPSENIQCSVGQEVNFSDIYCTIIERGGPLAYPRPSGCTASGWGHIFLMGNRGPVSMDCRPLDRNRDAQSQADYGVTATFGGITCTSERTGLTCRNEDGHGFFLSRRSQQVF
ncbi:DUF6636 domain-containing protein [uncultured Tateyamaria sp.]|uniref:DUF6636 domain-containing protein n=1 Tax=uncultured Tateyamaria sp. TaxID=455651 RepID=UPI002621B6C7|nr:DUF6636 domain-containing protein [uncultured Tateyamaria sp.]